jgi:biotin carboxyl carrier protein
MQVVMDYKKPGALVIFTLFMVVGYSQNTVNSYKYVLLPEKFEFLSSVDEYGLNATTKSLLEQKGFTVFWANGNLPPAVAANKCSALVAEVTQRKAIFTTNLTLSLKDCFGNIIFKSKEGRSREKEFEVAYDEALKNAFASLNYKYDSTLAVQQQSATAPAAAPATASAAAPATAPAAAATSPPATAPAAAPRAPVPAKPVMTDSPGTLYAQAISNGYQLIDTSPKKVMTLLKTSLPDCFLADPGAGAPNGIVFKKDGEWFFEYYKDGTLFSQKLTIKF